MKSLARLLGALTVTLLAGAHARAAVAVSSLRVSGTRPPYSISYTLGQDAARLTITIRSADTNEAVRTFLSLGINVEISPADLKMGPHPDAFLWDGRMDNGQSAPPGNYYAQALAVGNGASTLRLLSGPNPFTAAPGKSEARGLYGGDVNRNPNSPYRNLAYFGITATNSSGSAGVAVVDADGNSALFRLSEGTATGAYDYISASVMDDDAVMLDGQTYKRLTSVRPDTGAIQAIYANGKVNGRTMKVFGAGATARAYYVNADDTGVYLLNPLVGNPVLIVPRSALPGNARGLEVRPDESTLYVSGDGGYVYKFNRPASGNTWTLDAAFNMTALGGEGRGVALSPNNTVLWVANNSTSDSTLNRVVGVGAGNGALLASSYQYAFGGSFTPQGMAVSAGGNIFVQGYRSTASGVSANSVAVLAPPEGSTTDQTPGNTFTIPGNAGAIALSSEPAASSVSHQGATVRWATTVPSSSVLQIGTSPGVYTRTITQDVAPDLVTYHSVTVDGLDSARAYYYRVLSAAMGYTAVTSSGGSFTTGAVTMNGVEVTDITDSSAHVRWTTNVPVIGAVRYGTNPGALDAVTTNSAPSTTHDITVTGLAPDTNWFAAPEAGAPGATPVAVAPQPFTTLQTGRLLMERIEAGTESATLSWDTNASLAATVRYGDAPGNLNATASTPAGVTGTVTLGDLNHGTDYFYRIAFSGAGVAAFETPITTFRTETTEGAVKAITHSSAGDLAKSLRTNVDLDADGHLAALQHQAVPGTPVTTTPLPEPRYHHAVVAHNGYLYVIGGFDDNGNATGTVFYAPVMADGTVGAWAQTLALPTPRVAIANMAFGYSGRIYIAGGADADFNSLASVLVADQNPDGTLSGWHETTALPFSVGRDAAAVSVTNGRVYIAGGEDSTSTPAPDRSVYSAAIAANGDLGAWAVVGTTPAALVGRRTRANGAALYTLGGHDADDGYNDRAETAATGPSGGLSPFLPDPTGMSIPRYGFTAALTGGKLIAIAGRARPNGFTRAMEFAPLTQAGATGAWSVSPEQAPEAVDVPDGREYNGSIYSVGGRKQYGTGANAAAVPDVVVIPMSPVPHEGAVYAYSGTLESPVLDLGETTNLRRLSVAGAGSVTARYRYAGPAGVFSAWLSPAADGAISGGARYVQYLLTLAGDGSATPTVDSITLTTGPTAGTPLPGDVNMDGFVTRADAALALQMTGGLSPATDPGVSFVNADIDGDGHVTLLDVVRILAIAG